MLLALAWIFAPVYLRCQLTTIPELLEKRFNKQCRSVLWTDILQCIDLAHVWVLSEPKICLLSQAIEDQMNHHKKTGCCPVNMLSMLFAQICFRDSNIACVCHFQDWLESLCWRSGTGNCSRSLSVGVIAIDSNWHCPLHHSGWPYGNTQS